MKRLLQILVLVPLGLAVSGCIVIPIGDLLKGPALTEQVLVEGAGLFKKEKIAIIDVDGLISGSESMSIIASQENVVAETKARLERALVDPEVKAVVLRLSSPGGEVTACDVLHHEVKEFKAERGIPVVASIGDQGTSGGYYVAVAADTIYANPTAVVGSIGVILQRFDLSELLSKVGVAVMPIKSTERKDLNSPFRPMTQEERAVLQKVIDNLYSRFVDIVDEGRPQLSRPEVLALADGRVTSGTEAAELKLVDRVGYLDDAIEEARSRANIRSPTIVRYTRVAKSGANIYTQGLVSTPALSELNLSFKAGALPGPGFYYLWAPGL